MIKFFRTIRQRMLNENRFSRYFLYAIGEIVLVVIGILIALQINNWNQRSREHRAGVDLLEQVHSDLMQDTTDFRAIVQRNAALREEIKELLTTLYDGVDSIGQVKRMSNVYDRALDQTFSPHDNTYRSMVSTGTLGYIRNDTLKEAIMDLYAEYDQGRELLRSIGDWMIKVVATVDTETDFMKFGSAINDIYTTEAMLNERDYAFLNDQEDRRFMILVRAISGAAFNQKVNSDVHAHLITRCEAVLLQIDKELGQEP